jgi:hypothetical protein
MNLSRTVHNPFSKSLRTVKELLNNISENDDEHPLALSLPCLRVWQTPVGQAPNTDILEIERNSRHKFEFFMGLVGVDQPISAKTAHAFAKARGKIYHGLSVFEAKIRQPNQVGENRPLVGV